MKDRKKPVETKSLDAAPLVAAITEYLDDVYRHEEMLIAGGLDALHVQRSRTMRESILTIIDEHGANDSLDAAHPGTSAAQADLGLASTRPDEGAGPSESVRHAARRESRDAGTLWE